MEENKKVFLKAKFINFESYKNGIFLMEVSVDKISSSDYFKLENFNCCVSNRESFYKSADLNLDPVEFYKVLVEKKKEEALEGSNQSMAGQIHSHLVKNINEILTLDEAGNVLVNPNGEKDLKYFINKHISLKSYNIDLTKLGFFYEIDSYTEEEICELQKQVFSAEGEDENDVYVDNNSYIECSFVLSPLQGISIFLLEEEDIIYVKKNQLSFEEEDDDNEYRVVVKSIDFIDGLNEVIVKFEDGREGIIKEAEMVKVKGIKPSEIKEQAKNLASKNEGDKEPSLFNEFKKNLIALIFVIAFITLIIVFLNNF